VFAGRDPCDSGLAYARSLDWSMQATNFGYWDFA
jgi:hypothetical protein